MLSSVAATAAFSQVVKAPRYQGGSTSVEAPKPQLHMPPLPPAITPHGTVVEDIVVRVNDQIISRSDVQRRAQGIEQAAAQSNVPADEIASEQKNLLRDMIDQQLLLSRAKELGLNGDADLVRRLDEIRKQNKLSTMEDLEKAAKSQGINFEDFKAQQRTEILTQMVVRDEVGRKLQLTQADARKYYDQHKKDFDQPEQVRLSEILIPTPENATPEVVTQAEAKANDVKSKVMQNGDFAELAKKYSGGPSAAQGGELGTFKPGALPKVFEDATFPLKVGESTQPIRSRQGFVILKVTEHVQPGPAELKDVMQQIEEAIYMQQMQPALRAYLTKLRQTAYVDIQPGFVDSGSASVEGKFVNTAYAPPPVKKKTVKTKARFDRNGAYAAAPRKAVVASPDTTGTRTLTGTDNASTPAPSIDAKTGMANITARSNGKTPKMARREKIRFGQAPRIALPGGSDDAATTDTTAAAPGAVMASNGTSAQPESANLDDNPLTARAPEHAKTRFSAKAAEVKEKKVQGVTAKQTEKTAARPDAMTAEEKAAAAVQSAPLGLAGDTTKKPEKAPKVKGAPKERFETKPVATKSAPAAVEPTANPALAPTSIPATPTPATPPSN